MPVSDEQRDELRRRKERFLNHPQSGLSWEQVKSQARASA
jgi:putative addiction module component (TIGR02574 family)